MDRYPSRLSAEAWHIDLRRDHGHTCSEFPTKSTATWSYVKGLMGVRLDRRESAGRQDVKDHTSYELKHL
jgi:hypothetical protein